MKNTPWGSSYKAPPEVLQGKARPLRLHLQSSALQQCWEDQALATIWTRDVLHFSGTCN